jgi:lipoate-protein ligase A
MDPFRLILDPPKSGAENMAIDEALLGTMEEGVLSGAPQIPILRLYSWSEPTLSIGYMQKAGVFKALNGLPIVRRITGGRAVLHDTELTYSLVCPQDNPLFAKGIEGAYRLVSSAIVDTLKGVGIDASFEKGDLKGKAAKSGKEREACFLTTSRYEVVVRDGEGQAKKLAGSSQRRFKAAFLQHGSILLNLDRSLMEKVFGANAVENTTSVSELAEVDTDSFKAAFVEHLAESLEADFLLSRISPPEFCLAEDLLRDRYSRLEWNEGGGRD